MPPYIGGQLRRSPLHWWLVKKVSLTLVVSEEGLPYIGELRGPSLILLISGETTSPSRYLKRSCVVDMPQNQAFLEKDI